MVAIEGTYFANNAKSLIELTLIVGAVLGYCYEHSIEIKIYSATEWRKITTLNRYAKKRSELKAISKIFVKALFNIEVGDDESDAILIGLAKVIENKELNIDFWKLKNCKELVNKYDE